MMTCIVPSYNHEHYIEECLSALLKSRLASRILIVDDGSTDNSASVIKSFLRRNPDSRVELFVKPNGGLVSALNYGLSLTETEFLYVVASDDFVIPEGLDQALRKLSDCKSAQFIFAAGKNYFSETGRVTEIYRKSHKRFFELPSWRRRKEIYINYPSPLLLQSTIFRTETLKSLGGWRSDIQWDDYPIFASLLDSDSVSGREFIYDQTIDMVRYRQHCSNSYRQIYKMYSLCAECMSKICPAHLKNRALANLLAYYSLAAIRKRRFFDLANIVKNCSFPIVLLGVVRMLQLIAKKITGNL